MTSPLVCLPIQRIFADGGCETVEDVLLKERKLELYINGVMDHTAVMTAGCEECWALGSLRARGYISSMADVEELLLDEGRVCARLRGEPLSAPLPLKLSRRPVYRELIFRAIEELAGAELYRQTGCLHVVTLYSEEGERLFGVEDIGRHNAVDKAIGWLTKSGREPSSILLFLSGRMPEDMVRKALFAGITFMASVSAPTLDGVMAARAAGMTMAGFVRGRRLNLYSGERRIVP